MAVQEMKKFAECTCRIGVKAFVEKVSREKCFLRPARLWKKLDIRKMGVEILDDD